jgi:hypothetical protein
MPSSCSWRKGSSSPPEPSVPLPLCNQKVSLSLRQENGLMTLTSSDDGSRVSLAALAQSDRLAIV